MASGRTRSNKVFSPWDTLNLEDLAPGFDLERLLKNQVDEELQDPDDLLDHQDGEISNPASSSPQDLRQSYPPVTSGSSNSQPSSTVPELSKPPKPDQTPRTTSHRKRRRNDASHAARAKKRAAPEYGSTKPRKSVRERYEDGGTTFKCPIDIEKGPVTSTGYDARREVDPNMVSYPLSYFVGETSELNFTLERWNGKDPTALVDSKKRVVGILAGQPDTDQWPELLRQAAEAMEEARLECRNGCDSGRRGDFVSLQCGVSHGGGQKQPSNVYHSPKEKRILERLSGLEFFQRVSGFSTSVMATRTPALHRYYAEKLGQLYEHDPKLERPFPHSIQASTTYNLGPETVCYPHRDRGNTASGMCSITPAGYYDHKAGGHLVLWECRLVIEFPPGSTILIPSALITHSNTSIAPGERRYSFTQYTAGALFRWVDNHFQKASAYRQSLTPEEKQKVTAADAARWKSALALLPIVESKE